MFGNDTMTFERADLPSLGFGGQACNCNTYAPSN